MKKFIIFAMMLLSAPAWAAIARDGSCEAATSSCTFSATATGDLKIVIAITSASTLATLPSGWTTIATCVGGQSSGCGGTTGTIRSFRVGCNVSSSSGDTGTGTWTNSSSILAASYSGTAVGTTGNCNTTGIGGKATDAAQSSTTVNYDAITLSNTDNTSWVLGGAVGTGSLPAAPTGMTSVVSTGVGSRLSDTNATASSWTLKTVTVTSGTWVSFVGEILQHTPSSTVKRLRGNVVDRER